MILNLTFFRKILLPLRMFSSFFLQIKCFSCQCSLNFPNLLPQISLVLSGIHTVPITGLAVHVFSFIVVTNAEFFSSFSLFIPVDEYILHQGSVFYSPRLIAWFLFPCTSLHSSGKLQASLLKLKFNRLYFISNFRNQQPHFPASLLLRCSLSLMAYPLLFLRRDFLFTWSYVMILKKLFLQENVFSHIFLYFSSWRYSKYHGLIVASPPLFPFLLSLF